ncbi:uncharacterized protein BJ212DRAFT_1319863 [Suillus subaureus]|uniref:Uncharacterized protein n=1 Tax=Suillus subaureus TaxID=48587 RepID=A0A9P7EKA7_9AGAM|nr:uncharacterized protein BJ212DRAFT_1319863 [Suillus subaureus]KAG1824400.1 hypothetical protein BJ212DRAFT_1319863 [Suillus subaureus]
MAPKTRRQRAQAAHESEEIAEIQVEKELLNSDSEMEQENDENIFVIGDRDNEYGADENSFSISIPPPPRSLANPPRTPSHEDALRDITDEFFHPPSPSPIKAVPAFANLKPPRRPKKPKSLAFPANPPNWQPTSPLPPSSPLASTSTYGPQNYASTSHANAYEYNMTAFYRHTQEIDPRSGDSDPFGFLAAEKVLKERRAARLPSEKHKYVQSTVLRVTPRSTRTRGQLNRATSTPTRPAASSVPIPTNDEDIDDLYLDEPITTSIPVPAPILRHSHIPTPSSSPASLRSEIVVPTLLKPRLDILRDHPTHSRDPLRTPRKRKRDVEAATPASSDVVSSPSPVKISVAARGPQTPSDCPETADEHTPVPKRTTRAQAKGKGKAQGDMLKPRKRVRTTKEVASLSPRQACKDLEKLLPRRATTRRGAAVAKTGAKGRVRMAADLVGDSDSDEEQPKRRKPASRAQPSSSAPRKPVSKGVKKSSLKPRSKGKEKGKPLNDLMEMSDDTRERYEEERLARLEYFRKLDGYQMKKENVYVI